MVVLVTCKNKKDPIKNEGPRVATRLHVDFSDVKGQKSLQSMVISGRNSDSFKHFCMSSSPEEIKKITLKMKALEWPQHISKCKSREIFPNAQGQLTPQPVVGSGRNLNSSKSL